jgi:transcriptional regulator CtsR
VINNSGHRLPTGFSDGQRMWLNLMVSDGAGIVYRSGFYDDASATLFTDDGVPLNRALVPVIDASVQNAVMIYDRVTGNCTDADQDGNLDSCTPSFDALGEYTLFDNRIPPMGFDYAQYRQAGVKFWNYDPTSFVPSEDAARFSGGQNWDEVTYQFTGPADPLAVLTTRAEVQFQSHTREYMEYLRETDDSTVRPEGPPRPWEANYPLTPNYLSDEFGLADAAQQMQDDNWDVTTLNDNWGGIAYAAWYVTGKGAPYPVAVTDSAAALPGQVTGLAVSPECDANGVCTGGVINPDTGVLEAYTQILTWNPVTGADGYLIWIKYGAGATASWDKLAIVQSPTTELINTALNVDKTYIYKIQAFNGAGYGPEAFVTAKTPWDLPLPPDNLKYVSSTPTTITMSWYDAGDNEIGWKVFRQDVPVGGGLTLVATFPSTTGFGGVNFTDGIALPPGGTLPAGYIAPQPGRCYNYVVESYNTAGNSGWNVNGPVQMCTRGTPTDPSGLQAVPVSAYKVDLSWSDNSGNETGFRIERALDAAFTAPLTTFMVGPNTTAYGDMTVSPDTTYYYRVIAFNILGNSLPSNTATVTTPGLPPSAPTSLSAVASPIGPLPPSVTLTWSDNSTNETGFAIERMNGTGGFVEITRVTAQPGTNPVTFLDTSVQPKMTYTYRVRAFNLVGYSNYATSNAVVTPGQIPEGPANLRVTQVTKNSITLAWDDKSTNELGFYIERRIGTGAWVRIATVGPGVTTFTNTGLKNNTNYWYRVQAYNADGVSAYTAEAFAKTKK